MRAMPIVLMGLAVCLMLGEAQAQQPGRSRAVERAKKALAEPFVGITTDGRVRTGLFTRKKTGLSTLVVRQAAEAVLRGLSEAQRKRTLFPVDHSEWRDWANIHRFPRQGVSLAELGEIVLGEGVVAVVRGGPGAEALQKVVGEDRGGIERCGGLTATLFPIDTAGAYFSVIRSLRESGACKQIEGQTP